MARWWLVGLVLAVLACTPVLACGGGEDPHPDPCTMWTWVLTPTSTCTTPGSSVSYLATVTNYSVRDLHFSWLALTYPDSAEAWDYSSVALNGLHLAPGESGTLGLGSITVPGDAPDGWGAHGAFTLGAAESLCNIAYPLWITRDFTIGACVPQQPENPTPEPASAVLLGVGLAGFGLRKRGRKQ